jgi:cytochrome c-type biogenesis protein CcmH
MMNHAPRYARLLLFLLALVVASAAARSDADEAVLTSEQKARVTSLCRQLISPCCWTTSVADHGTGMAPLIEDTVRAMVIAGTGDREILDHFVAGWGERILAEPRHAGFNRIGYWMPWLAALMGLAIIVRFVRRARATAPAVAGTERALDPQRARIAEELRNLD